MGILLLDNKAFSLLILLLLSLSFSQASAQTCDAGDKAALLDFKANITNDPSGLLRSWNQSTNCCIWDGIRCNAAGRVINVTRTARGSNNMNALVILNGALTPSLGKLTHLQVLDLSYVHFLRGQIPQEIGNLKNIQNIILSGNQLSGQIPTSFRSLLSLKKLHLDFNNELSGDISQSFANLSSLSELGLAGNKFYGSIPSFSSKNLTWIYLRSNNISGHIPERLGNYSLLTFLDLSHNNLTGGIPEALSSLSDLRTLNLRQNKLSGGIPGELLNMESIVVFDVSSNNLSGEIPPHTTDIPIFSFNNNLGLCGDPLPVCT